MQSATATVPTTRVVLVLPHALPRLGLVRVLEELEGLSVVAHAGSVEEGTTLASQYQPDVICVDAELADTDAMSVVVAAKAKGVRVVLLADRTSVAQIERALEAGADAVTLKDISVLDLSETISRVAGGDTVLHPEAASALARRLSPNGDAPSMTLTARQREILRLIADGLENKQIARRLGIGVHTVKTHVSRLLHKLGANSRTEAVVIAMKERLIT